MDGEYSQLDENTFRSKNISIIILVSIPKVDYLHYYYSILILKFVMRCILSLISYSTLNKSFT